MRSTPVTHPRRILRGLITSLAISIAAACSKQPPPEPPPAQPLVTPNAASSSTAPTLRVVEGSVAAGGIPTTYRANFAGDRLESIEETRNAASATTGRYEFHGARLLKYNGTALRSAANIEIELSLQGAITATRANSGEVAAEEISAIRNRAQLLRSHALAQSSTYSHQTQ